MSKFIIGDKVSLKITDEIRNVKDFQYYILDTTDKINGSVIETYNDSCIVHFKNYGYFHIHDDCLDFRFAKNRSKFKKLGSEAYKEYRNQMKILDKFDVLSDRSICIIAVFNGDFTFVNVDNITDDYTIKKSKREISLNILVRPSTKVFDIKINVLAKKTVYEVQDYITKNIIDIRLCRSVIIAEFINSDSVKFHFANVNSKIDNFPRIALSKRDLIKKYPNIDSNKISLDSCNFMTDRYTAQFVYCVSEANAIEAGYKESLYNGMYHSPDSKTINTYYGYEEFQNICKNKIGSKSASYLVTEGIKYTFGIEIEMQKCFIPHRLRPNLNINCVRDGSINNRQGDRNGGPEFTTGVLNGDAGFIHLNKICNEITKRGVLDQSCGLHVHIGGASFSEEFIVMSYILGQKLEKQIFDLVPKSRRNSEYCTKLKELNLNFNNIKDSTDIRTRCSTYYKEIFKYLCGKYPDDRINKNTNHPRGRTCGYDHSSPRYNWLNFVPAVFNTKGVDNSWTIEFRLHSGTSNFTKIKNWIKLCMAFVYFADNFKEDIINNCVTIDNIKYPLTIDNIINKVFPKSGKNLVKYLNSRRDKFNDTFDETTEYSENLSGVLELNNVKEILN
jgi:hypothetical protein